MTTTAATICRTDERNESDCGVGEARCLCVFSFSRCRSFHRSNAFVCVLCWIESTTASNEFAILLCFLCDSVTITTSCCCCCWYYYYNNYIGCLCCYYYIIFIWLFRLYSDVVEVDIFDHTIQTQTTQHTARVCILSKVVNDSCVLLQSRQRQQ